MLHCALTFASSSAAHHCGLLSVRRLDIDCCTFCPQHLTANEEIIKVLLKVIEDAQKVTGLDAKLWFAWDRVGEVLQSACARAVKDQESVVDVDAMDSLDGASCSRVPIFVCAISFCDGCTKL